MRLWIAVLLFGFSAFGQNGAEFDTVIVNGRVIDPESHLDAVRQIGIREGTVAAITADTIRGRNTIDALGLVVAPGFIDLHSHGQDNENYRLKALDGVTTALEMEVGANPVGEWYRAREGKAVVNFGASSGHIPARMQVMHDSGEWLPRDHAVAERATPEQQREILARVRRGIEEGALGIGLGIAYVPSSTREEILQLFQLAAEYRMGCFVHMRSPGPMEPGFVDALQEVIADAAITGASLHVVHLPSMAFAQTDLGLEMIRGARAHGLDVTTEAYPYTAGMTRLETAVFDPGWQQRLGMTFGDLEWVLTGERLTAQTFADYRRRGGMVILHNIPEDAVRQAIADPMVMIASDGHLENGKGHPRSAGTYARVLGKYVRDDHALTLTEAIRKMSLAPAQRLENVSAAMGRKGRIRVGADADIAVFDPAAVSDRATYANPALPSVGMRYVLVGGTLVVRDGKLVDGLFPGRGVKSR
jgi:N-acyl-D-aspartate/D-glutamate deacylase